LGFSNEQDWWTPTSDPQVISIQAGDMGDYTNYATDVNYGLDGYGGYQTLPTQLTGNWTYDTPVYNYGIPISTPQNAMLFSGALDPSGTQDQLTKSSPGGVMGELGQAYDKFKEKPLSSTIDALGSKTGLALLGMGGEPLRQRLKPEGNSTRPAELLESRPVDTGKN
jgi:hypothetical protein